jgi:hypothetical protein
MQIREINTAIQSSHTLLMNAVESLTETQCMTPPAGKWTGLQHVKHIELAVSPLLKFMSDREKLFSRNFGMTDFPPRTYEAIETMYLTLLVPGLLAPERYTPGPILYSDKKLIFEELQQKIDALKQCLDQWTEVELDRYIIPHPLMGNISLREQLYFCIYHPKHHVRNIERTLSA